MLDPRGVLCFDPCLTTRLTERGGGHLAVAASEAGQDGPRNLRIYRDAERQVGLVNGRDGLEHPQPVSGAPQEHPDTVKPVVK